MTEEAGKSEVHVALQKIKEAEDKARHLIRDAQERLAPRIIQEAQEEARKIRESCLARAKKDAEEKKDAIIGRASKEADRIREQAGEEASVLRQKARKAMPRVVEKFGAIIKKYLTEGRIH